MLSHRCILENLDYISQHGGFDRDSVGVNWLPHFHDMGLSFGILLPLFSRFPTFLFSPASFAGSPVRWLRAISRFRATHSGGPNSSFELCVRRVTGKERNEFDLSSWRVAFNGSEPIRAETLQRFEKAFRDSGFRRHAFYPVYGLAEATSKVSSSEAGKGPVIAVGNHDNADEDDLKALKNELVSSGSVFPPHTLVVADPETGIPRREGEEGELWISGPSVARGYWNRPAETASVFGAHLANGEGPFLRTGDLGFVRGAMIIRGDNYYPQDIKKTVEGCHRDLRAGCAVAFSIGPDDEQLVIVAELERHCTSLLPNVFRAIRESVATAHGLAIHAVALIATGSLAKTSSGKVQRRTCRSQYLAGTLRFGGFSSGGPSFSANCCARQAQKDSLQSPASPSA